MAADVESISLINISSADAADHEGIGFEDDAGVAVFGQFIGGGKAGGAATGDDRAGLGVVERLGAARSFVAVAHTGSSEVGEETVDARPNRIEGTSTRSRRAGCPTDPSWPGSGVGDGA